MADRSMDWLRQAERDLAQAQDSHRWERYEWACFTAHQAAEKALKALHLRLGQEAWGHVNAKLLQELPGDVRYPEDLVDKAHVLDGYYMPTRYPNGHPEGAPFEHFGKLQSEEAIGYAGEIIGCASDAMARSGRG